MLEVTNLDKDYPAPQGSLSVLSGISFSLKRGDAVSIVGPSGSGKSTLLYILGALEPPTAGTVTLDGRNFLLMNDKEVAAFRNKEIGFVFQDPSLLPQCSVLENVLIPTLIAPGDPAEFERRARQLLQQVGLGERMSYRPPQLSGGEKQRVALARALIRRPVLLLCDEPTGNLDRASAEVVASLLLDLHRQQQTILIVVTHSLELASRFPIRYQLRDRQLHNAHSHLSAT